MLSKIYDGIYFTKQIYIRSHNCTNLPERIVNLYINALKNKITINNAINNHIGMSYTLCEFDNNVICECDFELTLDYIINNSICFSFLLEYIYSKIVEPIYMIENVNNILKFIDGILSKEYVTEQAYAIIHCLNLYICESSYYRYCIDEERYFEIFKKYVPYILAETLLFDYRYKKNKHTQNYNECLNIIDNYFTLKNYHLNIGTALCIAYIICDLLIEYDMQTMEIRYGKFIIFEYDILINALKSTFNFYDANDSIFNKMQVCHAYYYISKAISILDIYYKRTSVCLFMDFHGKCEIIAKEINYERGINMAHDAQMFAFHISDESNNILDYPLLCEIMKIYDINMSYINNIEISVQIVNNIKRFFYRMRFYNSEEIINKRIEYFNTLGAIIKYFKEINSFYELLHVMKIKIELLYFVDKVIFHDLICDLLTEYFNMIYVSGIINNLNNDKILQFDLKFDKNKYDIFKSQIVIYLYARYAELHNMEMID